MRYLLPVTDLALAPALTELNPAEARLVTALARPQLIAIVCVVGLTGLGWLALGLLAVDSPLAALCRPQVAGGWLAFVLALPMWSAMVLAMMLPTAAPMMLTYAEIADTAVCKGEPVVSPLMLALGYLAVWVGFALVAAAAQVALASVGLLEVGKAAPLLAGAMFLAAGAYQFSALKRACLRLCRQPFPFLFANWTAQRSGVLRLGLRQGLHCLGCCWAMMVLMFAVGVMNVIWMAALGSLMTIEKLASTARFSHAIGVALLALGFGRVAVWVLQVSGHGPG